VQTVVLIVLGFLVGLAAGPSAEAENFECTVFGRCFYESPGFRIRVVDKETGQPLEGVHALAEWQRYGLHGRNGPLMAQEAVSGPDGWLTFPAWGPVRGSASGLVINTDPGITLFKPGYVYRERGLWYISNAIPIGLHGTDRVHRFYQDGETFAMAPFRGTAEEWLEQIAKLDIGLATSRSDEQSLEFRGPYLNRLRLVWAEREKYAERLRAPGQFFWHVEREIKFLEQGRR
jgi:hypothetical protein